MNSDCNFNIGHCSCGAFHKQGENMSTNWANRTKQAAGAVPLTKPSTDRGTKHNGVVESFTPKSYKTGSFGVEIKYTVEGLERPVYENVVLTKLNDQGAMEATKYGDNSLKRRLQAFGFTSAAINAFPTPKTPKDAGNEAYELAGTPVVIYITQEEYMGRPQNRVKAVYPVDPA